MKTSTLALIAAGIAAGYFLMPEKVKETISGGGGGVSLNLAGLLSGLNLGGGGQVPSVNLDIPGIKSENGGLGLDDFENFIKNLTTQNKDAMDAITGMIGGLSNTIVGLQKQLLETGQTKDGGTVNPPENNTPVTASELLHRFWDLPKPIQNFGAVVGISAAGIGAGVSGYAIAKGTQIVSKGAETIIEASAPAAKAGGNLTAKIFKNLGKVVDIGGKFTGMMTILPPMPGELETMWSEVVAVKENNWKPLPESPLAQANKGTDFFSRLFNQAMGAKSASTGISIGGKPFESKPTGIRIGGMDINTYLAHQEARAGQMEQPVIAPHENTVIINRQTVKEYPTFVNPNEVVL